MDDLSNPAETPRADPHAGCCGEGRLEAGPYPIGRLCVVAKPDIVPFSTCNLGSPTPLLKWWGRQQRATDPRSGGIEDNQDDSPVSR